MCVINAPGGPRQRPGGISLFQTTIAYSPVIVQKGLGYCRLYIRFGFAKTNGENHVVSRQIMRR